MSNEGSEQVRGGRAARWRSWRSRRAWVIGLTAGLALVLVGSTRFWSSNVAVSTDLQMPGTQQGEILPDFATEPLGICANCHGGYDKDYEILHNALGSMMMHSGRDPIFWAQLAIAEQDVPGSGNFCLRCHVPAGWYEDRATPTNGIGLAPGDAYGVSCDICHKLTNPDESEHEGIQNPPYVANDGGSPAEAYYGAGQLVLTNSFLRLGPYTPPDCPHGVAKSTFHRSSDLCGSCHDVSNPMVGDLAHNHGAQIPLDPGTYSGVPDSPVDGKAAFNNFPFQYGIVERTYSEHVASLFDDLRVTDYPTLPADLQQGSIQYAYETSGGDYEDGTPRYFTCQTCHMPAIEAPGCVIPGAQEHQDHPLHDLTGGNYWVPDALVYMSSQGTLRLGGALPTRDIEALHDGKMRALATLSRAGALEVNGNELRVINLTGHKLISGYPEGRRMWLNVKWYDGAQQLIREDGAYGTIATMLYGSEPAQVETLLDLDDPFARIYEAEMAMTQEWASQLLGLGYDPGMILSYDRETGLGNYTLGDLAAQAPGTSYTTFHFVLNNHVAHDNRIPPYGMSYDEARERNSLPVPETQYGDPGPGGAYEYWDTVQLEPPVGAVTATIELLFQPTSWEYIQFVSHANEGTNLFLADVGDNLLDAWLNTGMASPAVIASAEWVAP